MWSSSPIIALFVSDLHLKCYLEVFFDHIFKIALSPPTFVEKYLSPYSALFFLLSIYHYRKYYVFVSYFFVSSPPLNKEYMSLKAGTWLLWSLLCL